MPTYQQGGQMPQQLPPLPVNDSTPYVSRSVNLNELIKLHRTRQKYEIVDKFFNNSYIMIQNRLQPIEVYYQHDMFKSYLQDLSLVYFKQIEFSQNVRLEYILRRLNYTLNGEVYKFKESLIENQFYEEVTDLFSEDYLQSLEAVGNEKKVLDLRNNINLCFLIDQIHSFSHKRQGNINILEKIHHIYNEINGIINPQHNCKPKSQQTQHHSIKYEDNKHLKKSHTFRDDYNFDYSDQFSQDVGEIEIQSDYFQQSLSQKQKKFLFFSDMLYSQQMSLKIIEAQLESAYFSNQINDPNLNQSSKMKLRYLIEINRQLIEKTTELQQLNLENRVLVKKIQRNLQIELNSGNKCICINDSANSAQNFGTLIKINSIGLQREIKLQKVIDTQYTQKLLFAMIEKLKLKVIADAIQKVYEIQRQEGKPSQQLNLLFHVSFQHGLGVSDAILEQKDFIALNDLREQSTLTSYLTPMKSCYSYISHNIYTFLKVMNEDFPYDKSTNNNSSIIKQIRIKMSRQKVISKTGFKQFYNDNFKICHNCKILCHKEFLRQCKKRTRPERYREEGEEEDDDSLYIQKNYGKKGANIAVIQCEKNYCLYCLKNQFNGKIFNEKGWCPACLDDCHCNTCLRNRLLKKIVDLYLYVGGQPRNIKTQRDIISEMCLKGNEKRKQYFPNNESDSQLDERLYESVIKREIGKGYSPAQIDLSLHRQSDILKLVLQREKTKGKVIRIQQNLFRQKISFINESFNYQDLDRVLLQELKRKDQLQKTASKHQQKQEEQMLQLQKPKRKHRRTVSRYSYKRKSRLINRSDEIYYNYYLNGDGDSDQNSSSFHIKAKKSKDKEKFYEPDYDF